MRNQIQIQMTGKIEDLYHRLSEFDLLTNNFVIKIDCEFADKFKLQLRSEFYFKKKYFLKRRKHIANLFGSKDFLFWLRKK